jgi:hypothetical protein
MRSRSLRSARTHPTPSRHSLKSIWTYRMRIRTQHSAFLGPSRSSRSRQRHRQRHRQRYRQRPTLSPTPLTPLAIAHPHTAHNAPLAVTRRPAHTAPLGAARRPAHTAPPRYRSTPRSHRTPFLSLAARCSRRTGGTNTPPSPPAPCARLCPSRSASPRRSGRMLGCDTRFGRMGRVASR